MSIEEESYEIGFRQAMSFTLAYCLRELGYGYPEAQKALWIMERERAINALRSICADHGDNDWPADLSLDDIINKHLANHLEK